MLAVIAVVSLAATALLAPPAGNTASTTIVTSFYPVYIAALNVAQDVDGVTVVNMVDAQTGCLHDYQMSPQDRLILDGADVLVINGAGAEPFLEGVEIPGLPVIDLSQGQALLESGHVHTHDHDHESATAAHEEAVNSHLWVSPLRYRMQIEALADALAKADPAHATQYRENAARYLEQVDAVWTRMKQAAEPFLQTPTVLFHDSLAYVAEDLGLTVAAALNVGEDSGVSAQTLSRAEDVLKGQETAILLYDAQYDAMQYTYLQELPQRAVTMSVNTAVSGADDPDAWIDAMESWCEAWEAAA